MENAVEALKIAFGIMIFVLALSMSISCFSQANSAVQTIALSRDRENEYTYVNQTQGNTRIVGIETVVPTMYRAYKENIEIYFFKKSSEDAEQEKLTLYYKTDIIDNTGIEKRVKDEGGHDIPINYVDLIRENFETDKSATEHLNIILGMGTSSTGAIDNKYYNQFAYTNGIYSTFKNYKFEEYLGEYYLGEGASKTKKRVITYIWRQDLT